MTPASDHDDVVERLDTRNGESVLDWLGRASDSFRKQVPDKQIPDGYKAAANEIRSLSLSLKEKDEEIGKLREALKAADEFRNFFVADADPAFLSFDIQGAEMEATQLWDEASKASESARALSKESNTK